MRSLLSTPDPDKFSSHQITLAIGPKNPTRRLALFRLVVAMAMLFATWAPTGHLVKAEEARPPESIRPVRQQDPTRPLLPHLFPTPDPTQATYLHVTVDLQGRPPAPHLWWETALQVTLFSGEEVVLTEVVTCDSVGAFVLRGLDEQAYTLYIKGHNTLANIVQIPALEPGPNLIHGGTLLAGDTTGDDRIDIVDFSLFRTLYRTTDPRADLNNSGFADILDFSLLRTNFGKYGPIEVEAVRR